MLEMLGLPPTVQAEQYDIGGLVDALRKRSG